MKQEEEKRKCRIEWKKEFERLNCSYIRSTEINDNHLSEVCFLCNEHTVCHFQLINCRQEFQQLTLQPMIYYDSLCIS